MGIPDVRLHDLRHSFASDARMGGVPLAIVGEMLGHRQPSTTKTLVDADRPRGGKPVELRRHPVGAAHASALVRHPGGLCGLHDVLGQGPRVSGLVA